MLISMILAGVLAFTPAPCGLPAQDGDGRTQIVEVVHSISDGQGGGYDELGYIAYNVPVKAGEEVTSIVIYNPLTDHCDDVLAVYDNGTWRFAE